MNISIYTLGDVSVVEIAGVVDSHASGQLYDALVNAFADGTGKLAVDLSGVTFLTRAGVRGIIVAAKLAKSGGGELRICGATHPFEVFLQGLGFTHLLKFDGSLELSVARLSRRQETPVAAAPEMALRKPRRWKIEGYGKPKDRPIGPPEASLDHACS